ncbi:DUF72 domain-containing protein [Micromonospora carbonacea]|uniref:DUF72 domain-containing protein n=1 Tax=Micromonospora carbonacea TaxID=47853 RepID=A0A7H8XHS9_9ACTN|nr:DUF72 domain-containing protein [Micromonospora carbonacea]MBB5827673.1 uncharacterized protein YecE (DUF72 family) [Micromonospora carbonacea]QLD24593.1 DUF72 domain-containing protein [Micromonospora carbonacea]
MGEIRVGTSSWADQLLLRSGWYPRAVNTPAGRLGFYAERFGLVEVDTSYYAVPAPETTAGWVAATPPGFTFDVKAFSLFTGHPTPVSVLPRDLRPAGGPSRVRRRDLPAGAYDELWSRFRAALEPIAAADRLGAVLLQFPPWLARSAAAERRIVETAARLRPWRVSVELRHGSWFADEATALRTLTHLREHDLSFVCVDMPQGFASSVPPILVATADPAVVRFHGHSAAWESGDKQDKFRYAYDERELRAWAELLTELAGGVDELHVLFNNCCGGQAQRDAARLAELVGEAAVAPAGVSRGG